MGMAYIRGLTVWRLMLTYKDAKERMETSSNGFLRALRIR